LAEEAFVEHFLAEESLARSLYFGWALLGLGITCM